MKIKKSNIITAVACTAALSGAAFFSGYATAADSSIDYNSQGKIVFDNGTENTVDDVIFDAADFFKIDKMVTDGKTGIKDALNEYDSIDISEDIPAFDTLAASISELSDGTDAAARNILSGKKALVEKSIVTGIMPDHSNTSTAADRIAEAEEGDKAEITIPEGYYDQDSKICIPIESMKENIPSLNSSIIIQAVNNRGGNLADDATNTEIANAINSLDLSVLGTVEYEYHYHDTSSPCYVPAAYCQGIIGSECGEDPYWADHYFGHCPICGRYGYSGLCGELLSPAHYNCNRNNGEIIRAIIKY